MEQSFLSLMEVKPPRRLIKIPLLYVTNQQSEGERKRAPSNAISIEITTNNFILFNFYEEWVSSRLLEKRDLIVYFFISSLSPFCSVKLVINF